MEDDLIRQAVNLWYGAGFGEIPWASALRATAELIGGGAAAVIGQNRATSRVERINVYGVDETVDEYVARMSQINPRTQYSLKLPGPHVITDYRVLPEAALGRSEFYDWLGRHHGLRYFVGARVYRRRAALAAGLGGVHPPARPRGRGPRSDIQRDHAAHRQCLAHFGADGAIRRRHDPDRNAGRPAAVRHDRPRRRRQRAVHERRRRRGDPRRRRSGGGRRPVAGRARSQRPHPAADHRPRAAARMPRLSPTPAVRWRWRGRADARRSWCG